MTNDLNIPRLSTGQFAPGNPGRRPGARGRMARRTVLALLDDFEAHREVILSRLRKYEPRTYAAMISRLLPPPEAESARLALDDLTPQDAGAVIARARAALDRIEAGQGELAELEAALFDLPPATPDGGDPGPS
jgi:hypothetical protein